MIKIGTWMIFLTKFVYTFQKLCRKKFKNNGTITIIMKKNSFINSIIITALIFTFVLANINASAKVAAETGVGKDVFKVIVTLYGITSSTKDIVTIVNVDNDTKVKVFNAENPENQGLDKVSYTITFPGLAVNAGDTYNVCTLNVNDNKISCKQGNNSPLTRPEFVDIKVSGKAVSGKASEK